MDKLTLGSLFDGSGGFPLGGLLCGIEPLWASEIEPFPIRVTTKRIRVENSLSLQTGEEMRYYYKSGFYDAIHFLLGWDRI